MKSEQFFLGFLVMLALSSITAAARAECSFGRDTCLQGYVWRDAFPGDHVCVTVTTRTQTAHDNSQADAEENREVGHLIQILAAKVMSGDKHALMTMCVCL